MGKATEKWQAIRLHPHSSSARTEEIVVEEPLEIRLTFGTPPRRLTHRVAVTMRTPGSDELLALGFLFSEGIIDDYAQVTQVRRGLARQHAENVIEVALTPETQFDLQRLSRNFYTTSSCGICGKGSIEAIELARPCIIPHTAFLFARQLVCTLPEKLGAQQTLFRTTGGLHAAALFDAQGQIVATFEDVGRHNALDKLIGWAWKQQLLPLHHYGLLLSGRLGFELAQKAAMAGIPFIAAIGAPTSLALQLAEEVGITTIAFLRPHACNCYTHPHRLIRTNSPSA